MTHTPSTPASATLNMVVTRSGSVISPLLTIHIGPSYFAIYEGHAERFVEAMNRQTSVQLGQTVYAFGQNTVTLKQLTSVGELDVSAAPVTLIFSAMVLKSLLQEYAEVRRPAVVPEHDPQVYHSDIKSDVCHGVVMRYTRGHEQWRLSVRVGPNVRENEAKALRLDRKAVSWRPMEEVPRGALPDYMPDPPEGEAMVLGVLGQLVSLVNRIPMYPA